MQPIVQFIHLFVLEDVHKHMVLFIDLRLKTGIGRSLWPHPHPHPIYDHEVYGRLLRFEDET